MWSFVGAKESARWLGMQLIITQGEDWPTSLAPGRMQVPETPGLAHPLWHHALLHGQGGGLRHLPPKRHTVGKLWMQKIERKHLTLRTRLNRLARKTLCFSHSFLMHDLFIGLYMNNVEFGCTA